MGSGKVAVSLCLNAVKIKLTLGYCFFLLVLWAVLFSVVACGRTIRQEPPSVRSPEANSEQVVSEKPPLLLNEGDGARDISRRTRPVADNSRCHVCHMNYEDEELAVVHARANIGCEKCHGSSDAHCSDEDHLTPPDVMYPLTKINPSCMECHTRDRIDIMPHQPIFDGTASDGAKHCTDCHGSHRLARRTRAWDKATGKLQ